MSLPGVGSSVSTRAVHQFLPSLAPRDAIGAHTLAMQRVLRNAGIESDISAGETHRELRAHARSYKEWRGGDAILMYHAAIGCALGDWMASRAETVVLDYHNITPPEYFETWAPETGLLLAQGRSQLARLAPMAAVGLADSAYNAHELSALGCARTAVIPIFIDPSQWGTVDTAARDALRASKRGADWLFVGRVAANKAHHDLLCSFAMYCKVFDPHARLWIVGGISSGEYWHALHRLAAHLGIEERVTFAGSVSDGELGAYYDAADVFVCVSDHEGFCVPLVEAMWWGVPVVAFGSTAIPGTMLDAGVVLDHKQPAVVAAAVARVIEDAALRDRCIEAGKRRVGEFDPAVTAASLLRELAPL